MAHTLLGLLDKKSIQIKENGDIIYYKNGTFSHSLWDKHADVEKIIPKGIRQEFKDKVYLPLKNHWKEYNSIRNTAQQIASAFELTLLPMSCNGNKIQYLTDGNKAYYIKFNYKENVVSVGKFYIGLLRGIHSDAKNKWLITIAQNWDRIMATEHMTDRRRILEELAKEITGIGKISIDITLAHIELEYAELH